MALLATTLVAIVAALWPWMRERIATTPRLAEWVVGGSTVIGGFILFVFALACAVSGRPPRLAAVTCLLVGALLIMKFIQLVLESDRQRDEIGFALFLGVALAGRGVQLLHRNLTQSTAATSGDSAIDSIEEAGQVE